MRASAAPSTDSSAATLIVLDASGSMRERIGGETKMVLAQRAVRALVESLPPETVLGLVAYSHRRNECDDIELLVPPAPLDQAALLKAVDGLAPRGPTPLAAALRFAVQALGTEKRRTTIVLVSDGLETCGGDPCLTANELAQRHPELTIHAVGFDLAARDARTFACIATATNGRFLQANDAASLKDALGLAVAEATAPAASPQAEVLTAATLKVPPQVTAGAAFAVDWTGPDNPGDYVTIVPQGAPDDAYESNAYTKQGSPLKLTAPIDAGAAEVRYVATRSRTVLARAPLVVRPAEVTLSAPAETSAGAVVTIEWTGPANAGDYLTIVPRGAADGKYENYANVRAGQAAPVTAPIEPGECEIRYMTGQGAKVLARRPLKVVAAAITLSAPTEVKAGGVVAITWTGPGNSGDYLTLVAAGTPDGKYANYAIARAGQAAPVTAPIEPGECEIRYMAGQGARVLARRPIRVVATPITLAAPERVAPGANVVITWIGPDNAGDYLTIVPAGAAAGTYAAYAYTRAGSPATVAAPKAAGPCEIRYLSGQGAKTLAARAITVESP